MHTIYPVIKLEVGYANIIWVSGELFVCIESIWNIHPHWGF